MMITSSRYSLARGIALSMSALLALLAYSCKDNGVSPSGGGQTAFSAKFTVTRGNGQAASGLEISVFNMVRFIWGQGQSLRKTSPQNVNSISTIEFSASQSAFVSLAVFDLDGTLVSTIMDHRRVSGGNYAAQFLVPRLYGTRVYKCVLVATDTAAGAMLYRDSVYAALCSVDPSNGLIGTTSGAGTFETRDSLLFPNLLCLPPLTLTSDAGPDSLGIFQLVDTVNVVLTDTAAHQSQTYLCVIRAGSNDIHLVWNPAASKLLRAQLRISDGLIERRRVYSVPGGGVPIYWKLYQNYPNPFD